MKRVWPSLFKTAHGGIGLSVDTARAQEVHSASPWAEGFESPISLSTETAPAPWQSALPSCSLMRLLFCLGFGVFLPKYLNKIICLGCLGGLLQTPKPEGFFPKSPDLSGFSTH